MILKWAATRTVARMDAVDLEFSREFGVSPVVVWDALIDPELVIGWLGEARIEAKVGGRYDLVWLHSQSFPPTTGTISLLEEPRALTVESDNRGTLRYGLVATELGALLHVGISVVIERAFIPRIRADWQSNLDQLEEMLRGHPVDWANWDRDRAPVWQRYLRSS